MFDERFADIGNHSSLVMADYCHRRGYEFVCYRHVPDPSRPASWNKIRLIQQELQYCDWLIWMDADAIPVNPDFSIERLIEKLPDKDFLVSSDENGLCFGVFVVRNCAWSVKFFDTIWFVGQMDLDFAKQYHMVPRWEQVSAIALMKNFPSIAEHIQLLPMDFVSNPLSDFCQHSFAIHYWATGNSASRITRKMDYYKQNGWTPQSHRDPLIVMCANGLMKDALTVSRNQNEKMDYEMCIYDINGEMGNGRRFNCTFDFAGSIARHEGKLPCKPQIIRQALLSEKRFLAYMDADAFAIRRFDEVNTPDYDIGVTMRRPEERGKTSNPLFYSFLNAGVMFFNYTRAALDFLDMWQAEVGRTKNNSDQQALNVLVLHATDLTEYNRVFRIGNIRIKIFKTDDYNFYYFPQDPLPTTKIVHCKTDRREALFEWGSREW